MKTIIRFAIKEFIQFKRDPKMFGLVLIAPIVQLILLGYAINFDVETVHTAVFNMDKGKKSVEYLREFEASGYFSFDYFVDNYDELTTLLDNGNVILGLVISDDFGRDLSRGTGAKVQAIFDASDGNTASIAAGYVNSVTTRFATNIIVQRGELTGKKISLSGTLIPEIRVWYNPELKTRNFMIPGVVGLLLMIITIILTSLAIVKEKEIGTMEQIIVTPVKPIQMIIGKLIPFIIIGFIVEVIILNAMKIIFDIQIMGSSLFLYFATFLYILSTLGLGIFVSTISKTQQQAMMIAIFVIMMPMIYLSGFAFPIENMPWIIQQTTHFIPLKYFMTIIRGVILKGTGLAELWSDTVILLGIGIIILTLSVNRFKKNLD